MIQAAHSQHNNTTTASPAIPCSSHEDTC